SAGKTAGANGGAQQPSSEAGRDTASARMAASLPSSRLGGAVLLGAILAGVIVAVVLLAGGGSHPKRTVASSTATSGNSKASTGASGPKIDNRLTLKSPSSSSPAIGRVGSLSNGGNRAL